MPIWQRVVPSLKKKGQFELPELLFRRYALYKNEVDGWIIINHEQFDKLLKAKTNVFTKGYGGLEEIMKSSCKTTYEW